MAIYLPIIIMVYSRTTLFTTMLLIIVVCLLKSRCIPSFVLIVCCVNELLGHLSLS